MRFLNYLLAFVALFVMCVSAAPTANDSTDTLPMPDPNSPTYKSDLAAVVAYARNDLSVSTVAGDKQCGIFIDLYEHTNIPTYASATTVCRNTAPNQQMQDFMNWYCGFCIVFDGTACQGVERWSGGPSPKGENDAHDVTGARSYFCY